MTDKIIDMTTQITLPRELAYRVLNQLDVAQSLLESAKSNHHHATFAAYESLRAALTEQVQPESITPGSWGDLKLMMEQSAWGDKIELSDAISNIDDFASKQALAQPEQEPAIVAGVVLPEPYGYDVYVEEADNGYIVYNLDDPQLVDDATNCGATTTKLYTADQLRQAIADAVNEREFIHAESSRIFSRLASVVRAGASDGTLASVLRAEVNLKEQRFKR